MITALEVAEARSLGWRKNSNRGQESKIKITENFS